MKQHCFFKNILLCIMLATVYSCSKTEEPIISVGTVEPPKIVEGCEIKDPETALCKGCLKADYIYIYGSRKMKENEPEKLWIAQYSLQHELLKEYISTVDALSLYVLKMTPLQNGKYLITSNCGNLQSASITDNITEQVPAILDPAKKELLITRINKGYFFDIVIDYENFILLSLSDAEINSNPAINPKNYQSIQMNYKGEILFNTTNMRVPDKNDSIFWINHSDYITANQSKVCYTCLDGNKEDKWKQEVNAPAQSTTIKIATVGNDAKVEYSYEDKERTKIRIYNFDIESGQQKITAEKISTCIDSNETALVSNKEFDLQASILPADTYLNHLKYETSDASVATVTENGIVKTHKNGNCIIYICSEDGFAEQEIKLTVSSLSFTRESYDMPVGKTKSLEIVKEESIDSKDLLWESNDESIATVNEQGEVTGLQKGETTITVTSKDGLLKASCTLQVKDFMEYINVTNSLLFYGNEISGTLSLNVAVANQSEDDAEIVSLSLCYEKDDQVTNLAENEKLASDTIIEKSLKQFTVYPKNKPYLKLIIRHQSKVYETKYSLSLQN